MIETVSVSFCIYMYIYKQNIYIYIYIYIITWKYIVVKVCLLGHLLNQSMIAKLNKARKVIFLKNLASTKGGITFERGKE